MPVQIQTIDYVAGLIVTSDRRRLPITNLFDRFGLPTTNSRAAVICVAGGPGRWLTFQLAPFERRALQ